VLKNKKTGNNGFSQAVVPSKSPYNKNVHKQNKAADPSAANPKTSKP
jgi:hypothetical protein